MQKRFKILLCNVAIHEDNNNLQARAIWIFLYTQMFSDKEIVGIFWYKKLQEIALESPSLDA